MACLRDFLRLFCAKRLRDPKIDEDEALFVADLLDEEITRLQVSMDDADVMRLLER